MRKRFRRRAAIEPVISHLKADFRLLRCFLKGFQGDQLNLMLAARRPIFCRGRQRFVVESDQRKRSQKTDEQPQIFASSSASLVYVRIQKCCPITYR